MQPALGAARSSRACWGGAPPYELVGTAARATGRGLPAPRARSEPRWAWVAVLALYGAATLLDLVRGVIHTLLYQVGLNEVSGLATGARPCDDRLAALMIAYGGSNLESFLVRAYALYLYGLRGRGRGLVRVSSLACALWYPLTVAVSSAGRVDVGDADLPGRYAMLARAIASLCALLLTFI